jgi:tetratricopeptide (TPR) repeat protein
MTKRKPRDLTAFDWPTAESLYHRLLDLYYARGETARAVPVAFRLLRTIDKLDPNSEALLTLAARSVLAELDGDLDEAIRYRVREVEALDRLAGAGTLDAAGFDAKDLRDRYELLANLCLDAGRLDESSRWLDRSRVHCKQHRIRFDGRDIDIALRRARKTAA